MSNTVDPKQFSLPAKTIIEELGRNHYALVLDRKSRVIMADGKSLLKRLIKLKRFCRG